MGTPRITILPPSSQAPRVYGTVTDEELEASAHNALLNRARVYRDQRDQWERLHSVCSAAMMAILLIFMLTIRLLSGWGC